MHEDGLSRGHVVLRQLHDEGRGLAGERRGLFEHYRGAEHGGDSDEEHERRYHSAGLVAAGRVARYDSAHERDDGELRSAWDEGRRHYREAAVVVLLNRARGHDSGDAAARGDEQRDEALAGEAEVAEYAVHNEGDADHVAAVLEYR